MNELYPFLPARLFSKIVVALIINWKLIENAVGRSAPEKFFQCVNLYSEKLMEVTKDT
jgi:hypothetical protein